MRYFIKLYTFALALLLVVSCAGSPTDTTKEPEVLIPEISLGDQEGIYSLKVGAEITLEPIYSNVDENTTYEWRIDNELIASTPTFKFNALEEGITYLEVCAASTAGKAYKEYKIVVNRLLPPVVQLQTPSEGFTAAVNQEFTVTPSVEGGESVTFAWFIDGERVTSVKDLSYTFTAVGDYDLLFEATNDDGTTPVEASVSVVNIEDIPFGWSFEKDNYVLSIGREVRIKIWDVVNDLDGDYIWSIDGEEQQRGKDQYFIFEGETVGKYSVSVEMENRLTLNSPELSHTHTFNIEVAPAEGTYRRPSSASSNSSFNAVLEFLAAPGQFVNDSYTCYTMEEAVAHAQKTLTDGGLISLGAFGGYITFGWDHSIDNKSGYDFLIGANPFKGSSEPGIVMVMQDENGDGLPNDTWYELNGSERSTETQIEDYQITYFRPTGSNMAVQWRDNLGASGEIAYNGAFHSQETYFPMWHESDNLTFRGTRLNDRSVNVGGEGAAQNWVNKSFPWGYADNNSEEDKVEDPTLGNKFDISNAIDYKGDKVALKYIDFVRVYTGVNRSIGWLGEISTEVTGAYEL